MGLVFPEEVRFVILNSSEHVCFCQTVTVKITKQVAFSFLENGLEYL